MQLYFLDFPNLLKRIIISNMFKGTYVSDGINRIGNDAPAFGKRLFYRLNEIDVNNNRTGNDLPLIFEQRGDDVWVSVNNFEAKLIPTLDRNALVFTNEGVEYFISFKL